MIVACGLTPAWQRILVLDALRTGMVNRVRATVCCASGKVLNVGAALHHLGADSLTVCPLGGTTGQQIQDDFATRGISARWLLTQSSTRVCTTLLDAATGETTELVENSAALTDIELRDFADLFVEASLAADLVVLSGSVPQRTPADYFRQLMERIQKRVILDVRGRELMECLSLRPLLIKPNRDELAATMEREITSDNDAFTAMAELRAMGAEWVVVSHGTAPLLALGPDGPHRFEPISVKTVNPIGCGDSLTAAIASSLDGGMPMLEAISNGMVYASRKAAQIMPVLPE